MKSKSAAPSVLVPRFIGRSESDMVAHGHGEQLDLFREVLTRPAKVQVVAMFALSDPKHLDRPQYARIADILRAMGYEQKDIRADGRTAFPSWMYESVEETGLKLRRKTFPNFIREPAGFTKDGRRKWKVGLVDLSILQDFGFFYEDEDGNPIDMEDIPKEKLIKYESFDGKGQALFAIPMVDDKGNIVKNIDGSSRRRMANGVTWSFSSRIAKLTEDRLTAWVFYKDAIPILRKYLNKPTTFDLIFKTIFWTGSGIIEMSFDTFVAHFGIKGKDRRQVEAAIAAAFADALAEGIIDKPVTVRPKGYYQATKKTGRPRRVDQVYQWKRASRWQPAGNLIAVTEDQIAPGDEDKTESMKS
jgi:hypothetical protein